MLNNNDFLPLFIAVQEKCFVGWVEPVKNISPQCVTLLINVCS